MAKKNKINCKDGLEGKEEIQARRLRDKLEQGDKEIIEFVKILYAEWYKKPSKGFLQWLYDNDKRILSSALKRMDDWTSLLV